MDYNGNPSLEPINAIRLELETFAKTIREGRQSTVPLEDGLKALELAYHILHQVDQNNVHVG